jgi:signal transduction histidine kinase
LRFGEAVQCIHSDETPHGCGTSHACKLCGAAGTITQSRQTGEQSEGACRIAVSANGGDSYDLAAKATQIVIDGSRYTILAMKDISSEKRLQVLEHAFFHDIQNSIGGMKGVISLLLTRERIDSDTEKEYVQWILEMSDFLTEEISQQQRLLAAERGTYSSNIALTDVRQLLIDVCNMYCNHMRTPGRNIVFSEIPACVFRTDAALLRRVVGNMILNALEATCPGDIVRVSLSLERAHATISVTNPGEIPNDVQLQIFKRSFSTKASSGRGVGTYCMKLFGEKYLGGSVGFASHNGATSFYIILPRTQ